jgi:hypothetical protein
LLYKFYKYSNVLIAIATSFKSHLLTLYKAKEAIKLIKPLLEGSGVPINGTVL